MADTGIFAWLDRAESCGDRDVERAALVMKDYYQGVGAEPEYAEQALASRPAEVDDLFGPQRFLNWNRSQEVPPVAIGKEMYVAQKAVELSKSAPSHTTNKDGA